MMDSRLRGNDSGESGNDSGESGNDGGESGNDSQGLRINMLMRKPCNRVLICSGVSLSRSSVPENQQRQASQLHLLLESSRTPHWAALYH